MSRRPVGDERVDINDRLRALAAAEKDEVCHASGQAAMETENAIMTRDNGPPNLDCGPMATDVTLTVADDFRHQAVTEPEATTAAAADARTAMSAVTRRVITRSQAQQPKPPTD